MKRSDLAELLLLAALWGASYLFMRLGAAEFGAFALAGVRSLVAALIMTPLVAWRGEFGVWKKYGKDILVVGLTNSALPFVLFSFAALSIAAGLSAVINATVPLFAASIGWLWLKDRLTPARVAGLAIGFAGVVWLVADKASFKPGASHVGWAILACLAATFLYGFSANFSKRRLADAAPVAVAAGGHLVSAVVLFVPMLALWPATAPSARAWSAALALAVFCTAFAYVLYYRLIVNVGASRTVTVAYLIPVFGVLWGTLFLGESFTLDMALGCAVILVGVALTTGLVSLRPKLLVAACFFVVCLPAPVRANEGRTRAEALVENVYAGDLPNAPGKRLSVITVTYPPGAKSAPHRHDAFVFAYVLSGRVRSRVDDGTVREYAAGQGWSEAPNALHAVSENASATEPATFLVVFVADPGAVPGAPAR